MKYLQLQRAFLTQLNKELQGKGRLLKCEYEGKKGFTDGYQIWLIPNDELVLNLEPLKSFDVEKFIKGSYSDDELELTNELITIGKNKIAQVFKSKERDFKVYVDKDYLKYLDLDIVTFKCKDVLKPVKVYIKDELIGIVMPMRMNR